jgi:hypothetical protein
MMGGDFGAGIQGFKDCLSVPMFDYTCVLLCFFVCRVFDLGAGDSREWRVLQRFRNYSECMSVPRGLNSLV